MSGTPLTPVIGAKTPRILIVDDELPNQRLLVAYLTRWGCIVKTAANGVQARTLARSFDPDLILLDVVMVNESGFAICDALREDPATQHIPVIFVTALSGPKAQDMGFATGADDYVTKPFDFADLAIRIDALLRQKDAEDALRAPTAPGRCRQQPRAPRGQRGSVKQTGEQ